MRRSILNFGVSISVLILCEPAEARGHRGGYHGHRNSAYRHINSRGRVSYYHGHGGGRHRHASISAVLPPSLPDALDPIDTPTVRPHKYLYRYRCGDHWCYKYPSNHIGSREGASVMDVPPATPESSPNEGVGQLARELGVAAAVHIRACNAYEETPEKNFESSITTNFSRPMSALGEEARMYFAEGLHSQPVRTESCAIATDNHAKVKVRFFASFFPKDGRPDDIYAFRLAAARYESLCQSPKTHNDGELRTDELLPKIGLTREDLSQIDAATAVQYAKFGEIGCISAARVAHW